MDHVGEGNFLIGFHSGATLRTVLLLLRWLDYLEGQCLTLTLIFGFSFLGIFLASIGGDYY